jgi:hypothetical protein
MLRGRGALGSAVAPGAGEHDDAVAGKAVHVYVSLSRLRNCSAPTPWSLGPDRMPGQPAALRDQLGRLCIRDD